MYTTTLLTLTAHNYTSQADCTHLHFSRWHYTPTLLTLTVHTYTSHVDCTHLHFSRWLYTPTLLTLTIHTYTSHVDCTHLHFSRYSYSICGFLNRTTVLSAQPGWIRSQRQGNVQACGQWVWCNMAHTLINCHEHTFQPNNCSPACIQLFHGAQFAIISKQCHITGHAKFYFRVPVFPVRHTCHSELQRAISHTKV
jgi:hypothetical protein